MAEEGEEETATAPLIEDLRCDGPALDEGQARESDLATPNRFIWALTWTAGISGLLFGYECDPSTSAIIHGFGRSGI